VFFEVPNVSYTLRDMGVWDLIYEHCSYFSTSSLSHLFIECGFDICELSELYEGQFLGIDVLPNGDQDRTTSRQHDDPAKISPAIDVFADKYREKVGVWKKDLERIASEGQRAVVWGGGSKGVMFLNTLRPEVHVMYMVDINPRKQGMYVAGTGQEIVRPEFLQEYRPDFVIVMNPIYKQEIQQQLDRVGVPARLIVA
jgi:hypothetical protein